MYEESIKINIMPQERSQSRDAHLDNGVVDLDLLYSGIKLVASLAPVTLASALTLASTSTSGTASIKYIKNYTLTVK